MTSAASAEPAAVGATLRAYVTASGALAATAVIGDAIVRCDADGTLELQRGAEPEALDPGGTQPPALGVEPRRVPPFDADEISGEVTGIIGGLEHVAECLRALCAVFGDGSVALVELATSDGTLLALSARAGEGVVVVVGDEQYEMDLSWPPPRP